MTRRGPLRPGLDVVRFPCKPENSGEWSFARRELRADRLDGLPDSFHVFISFGDSTLSFGSLFFRGYGSSEAL